MSESLYRLRVVGFARTECKLCAGRGVVGRHGDEVMPCDCVTYFDIDDVRKSAHTREVDSNVSDDSISE